MKTPDNFYPTGDDETTNNAENSNETSIEAETGPDDIIDTDVDDEDVDDSDTQSSI